MLVSFKNIQGTTYRYAPEKADAAYIEKGSINNEEIDMKQLENIDKAKGASLVTNGEAAKLETGSTLKDNSGFVDCNINVRLGQV